MTVPGCIIVKFQNIKDEENILRLSERQRVHLQKKKKELGKRHPTDKDYKTPPKNSEVIFKLQFYILPKCQEMWIHMKVTGRYARILKKLPPFIPFVKSYWRMLSGKMKEYKIKKTQI